MLDLEIIMMTQSEYSSILKVHWDSIDDLASSPISYEIWTAEWLDYKTF